MRNLVLILAFFGVSCHATKYDRQELYNKEISKYNLGDRDTLLDIGCGLGFHDRQIAYLKPNVYFVLEDINKSYLARIEKYYKGKYSQVINNRYELVLGSVDSIPLKSNSFKKILCRKTLHEFDNPTRMIIEMKRILSLNGELIIVEPRPKYLGQKFKDCKKEFLSQDQIIKMFTNEGFHLKSAEAFVSDFNDLQDANIITFTK